MIKIIESIFHLSLIAAAFIAYFFGHLHFAFWFAVAWAVYLFIASAIFFSGADKVARALEELAERTKRSTKAL